MHISPRNSGIKAIKPFFLRVWDCRPDLTAVEDTPRLAAWMAKNCPLSWRKKKGLIALIPEFKGLYASITV
ncbi:hypothetical protein SLEP1_g7427 [Rubroshorea leprosula]|uniref:Uncharacterized protein n=1 Tax=Rubroshorea leprosula TaxID=152421 RepID=A0AAV5I7E2_9ROSI|nr:hypothetical protein SLEP1_g7427 [Rubroshorea leprosula]